MLTFIERESLFSPSNLAASQGLNFHTPAPSSSTIGILPSPGIGGPAHFYLESLPYGPQSSTEFRESQSKYADEAASFNSRLPLTYHSFRDDLPAPGEATYGGDFSTLNDIVPELRYMSQPHSTYPNQHSVTYLNYELNEIEPLSSAPEEGTLPSLVYHSLQNPLPSSTFRASKGSERKREEITEITDVVGPSPPRKKRKSFANMDQKEETALVREVGACLRCAIQRNKVKDNQLRRLQARPNCLPVQTQSCRPNRYLQDMPKPWTH
jgi:hypothetical protein